MTAPWDIYAEQLLPLGYGYPLWIPEPNGREIHIADIGWLKDGAFRPLFNSMRSAGDPLNKKRGVPENFIEFDQKNAFVQEYARISQRIVSSRSIRTTETSAAVNVNP